MEVLRRIGYLIYVASPNATTFEKKEDVPNYVNQVIPLFIAFLFIEAVINYYQKGIKFRLNDSLTSLSHGLIQETFKLATRGVELVGYQWLYERRLIDLDWSSPITWWIAALGYDLGYYWFHRLGHEINIAWAAHQVHHSSEEYNLTTALRQSAVHNLLGFGFHQPLALLGVPLPAVFVHAQFNLLYQFWIHMESVRTLGPLEWVMNTPSHHRVHHGVNKWCLDKNYAGVFIIWDRIFGTFEPERKEEKIVYGLVDQPQTFNAAWLQFFYIDYVIKKAFKMDTWSNSLKAIVYGPGWMPGTPRLGDPDTFPDIKGHRQKYKAHVPHWMQIYFVINFVFTLMLQQAITLKFLPFCWWTVLIYIGYILVTLGNIGALYDGWWAAPILETVRSFAFVLYSRHYSSTGISAIDYILTVYCTASTVFWFYYSIPYIQSVIKNIKLKQN